MAYRMVQIPVTLTVLEGHFCSPSASAELLVIMQFFMQLWRQDFPCHNVSCGPSAIS